MYVAVRLPPVPVPVLGHRPATKSDYKCGQSSQGRHSRGAGRHHGGTWLHPHAAWKQHGPRQEVKTQERVPGRHLSGAGMGALAHYPLGLLRSEPADRPIIVHCHDIRRKLADQWAIRA